MLKSLTVSLVRGLLSTAPRVSIPYMFSVKQQQQQQQHHQQQEQQKSDVHNQLNNERYQRIISCYLHENARKEGRKKK